VDKILLQRKIKQNSQISSRIIYALYML